MTAPLSGETRPVLWFFGAGRFASRCLSLLSREMTFDLVVTSPPSVGGRGMKNLASPVEEVCMELGITPHRSGSVGKDEFLLSALRETTPLAILVVDFGQKIPEPFLSAPACGCLNIHPSLLPLYRGAAPVQRSLLNGDPVTGVTLFRLVEQMDAGPILLQEEHFTGETETAGELLDILAEKGSKLFLLGVKCFIEGTCSFKEQNSESATYALKISNNEAEVSWNAPAARIVSAVRALNPAPGAFLVTGSKRLKIWSAKPGSLSGAPGEVLGFDEGFPVVGTAEGAVVLLTVQPEGKRRLDGAEWARGLRLKKGDFLH
ncbi:methionyl-tRNA formyltransferase [Aminivibrio pyruvatiphilus]|uniref:Methionyl-tRNA formyltransferase n=1 Tax=Aminivibrio pyruvatiphilus TaxID=1005740 RepID=A0A4R8M6V2_9BACT|nr:methionyl-tRNA formyltransferase [Aminivibrio pyruvatiphilus]TDY60558.1 methionyl-tRNA formyltransferase [Aminivibrio pyruvatiphilus]